MFMYLASGIFLSQDPGVSSAFNSKSDSLSKTIKTFFCELKVVKHSNSTSRDLFFLLSVHLSAFFFQLSSLFICKFHQVRESSV